MHRLKKLIARAKNIKKKRKLSVTSKSAYALASACSALLPTQSIIKQYPQSNARKVQNFVLVWLDNNIDEVNNNDCRDTITKLRQVVNTVNIFTNANECITFMKDIKIEQVFMITSAILGQTTVPVVHDMPQVSSIYIFDVNMLKQEKWTQKWQKVRGEFTEISLVCEALKQAAQECDQNSITMSFVEVNHGTSDRSLDELDQSFMYTQILKEIVLTVEFEQHYMKDLINYCRQLFIGNVAELENVDKFGRELI